MTFCLYRRRSQIVSVCLGITGRHVRLYDILFVQEKITDSESMSKDNRKVSKTL